MTNITKLKIVLVGDMGAGKSTLLARLIDRKFVTDIQSTLGSAYRTYRYLSYDQTPTIFEFWDTAGQERFRALTPIYTRNANGIIICIDFTQNILAQQEQFTYWVNIIREQWRTSSRFTQIPPLIFIASTKCDLITLQHERAEREKKIYKLFKDLWSDYSIGDSVYSDVEHPHPLLHEFTSAKLEDRVYPCFFTVMEKCILRQSQSQFQSKIESDKKTEGQLTQVVVNLNQNKESSGWREWCSIL
jgi:small GTP-binding protein